MSPRAPWRAALHRVLRDELGPTADVVRRCPHCGGTGHGRPRVVGLPTTVHVGLAYTSGLAVAAWSDEGPVGVDVERGEEHREWTRTEALLKAVGSGVRGLDEPLPDLPTRPLSDLPSGCVGTVAGTSVRWRAVTDPAALGVPLPGGAPPG